VKFIGRGVFSWRAPDVAASGAYMCLPLFLVNGVSCLINIDFESVVTLANKFQRTNRTGETLFSTGRDTGAQKKFHGKGGEAFRTRADALICAPLLQHALARKSNRQRE